MSFRSEIKWSITVRLKKPIEHSLEISVFELESRIPSIHKYLSVEYRCDRGYGGFNVLVNGNRLQGWSYDQESRSLLIPTDEVARLAGGSSCRVSVGFTETNAVAKVGDFHLYSVEYDIPKLYATSFEMSIECPELRAGWQEKLHKVVATLLRMRQVPKVIPAGKEAIGASDDEIRCNFHFYPGESPSFNMLFNPRQFDIVSLALGFVGGIIIAVIAGLITWWVTKGV